MIKRCNMMIFGSTGDLTYQKLLPAILDLYKAKELCHEFQLVCIGRKEWSLDEYLDKLDTKYKSDVDFLAFKSHITYHQMNFENDGEFESLKVFSFDKSWIYYLATAPRFFEPIANSLNNYGFLEETNGFRRVVFEKPFGANFHDAKMINKHISKILDESQIYRIDHYLGKEMIQNILLTRVYNSFFEMLWHKDAIECFEVVISESIGVKNRGSYYDHSGALKDMVQNHMFQIVALLAMSLPEVLIPDTIREEKTKILKKLEVTEDIVLGQYDGYLDEKDIPADSKTETFVAMKVNVDHKRWRDVPFFLKTGKALANKYAHIVVHFKRNQGHVKDNILVIQIQPEEGIFLQLNSKKPGISNDVTTVNMDYCHSCLKYGSEPSAYGRLILDIMLGDKSLFASWEEIETSWSVIDKIEKIKATLPLEVYKQNSDWDSHVLKERDWWKND